VQHEGGEVAADNPLRCGPHRRWGWPTNTPDRYHVWTSYHP